MLTLCLLWLWLAWGMCCDALSRCASVVRAWPTCATPCAGTTSTSPVACLTCCCGACSRRRRCRPTLHATIPSLTSCRRSLISILRRPSGWRRCASRCLCAAQQLAVIKPEPIALIVCVCVFVCLCVVLRGASCGVEQETPTADLLVVPGAVYEARFVEVKGPRDRLSDKQRAWLTMLSDAGVNADVCYVKETA